LLSPGQASPWCSSSAAQADLVEQGFRILRILVVGGKEVEQLGGTEHRVGTALLQHDPDTGHQGGVVALRVESEHPHGSFGDGTIPLEGLDTAGLAGPVRSEECQNLAPFGPERELVNR
jgi:hypothetical protein